MRKKTVCPGAVGDSETMTAAEKNRIQIVIRELNPFLSYWGASIYIVKS